MSSSTLSETTKDINNAQCYLDYQQACEYHDQLSGANDWKAEDQSTDSITV